MREVGGAYLCSLHIIIGADDILCKEQFSYCLSLLPLDVTSAEDFLYFTSVSLPLPTPLQSVNPSRGFPGRLRNLFGLRGTRGGDVYAQEVVDDEESTKVSQPHWCIHTYVSRE